MRSIWLGLLAALLSTAAAAQEDEITVKELPGNPKVAIEGYESLEPTIKQWKTTTTNADRKQVEELLNAAGWSDEYVKKALPAAGKYDLFQSAVAPGQVSFMAVPQSGGINATPVQFGVKGLGAIFGDQVETVSFEQIKNDALAQLRSTVEGACAMPGRPTSLRVMVTVKVVEIEATWETAEVCDALKQHNNTNP